MLELFIGLSIDFILVKSWWFDKAKLIKQLIKTGENSTGDQLWCWPLGRCLKEKKHLTNKKCSQGFSKLTLWRKKKRNIV